MKNLLQNFTKALICISLIVLSTTLIKAQANFQWAKSMGGASSDRAYAIATDASGNVYTTGYFKGVSDFDPGAGTFTMAASGSNFDIFVSKLDGSGNFVWAKQISEPSNDFGRGITIDGSGNVLITGSFQGNADFNPGAGVFNLNSFGSDDIFILKLDPLGNFVWARNLGGSLDDVGYGITTDASGNVYTTGYFRGTADFDPGVGSYSMTTFASNSNAFVSKLDASGNFVYAKQFNGTTGNPGITGFSIKLDGLGNVYTSGSFSGQIDFDPGVATFTVTAINSDMFICKLDASGNFVWIRNIGAPSGSNCAEAIAIDGSNNIYSTGYFDKTTDFDPGAGTFTVATTGIIDVFVLKLDQSGSFVWAKDMGGTGGDEGKAIAVSSAGEVYTTGYFNVSGDFDPGAGTFTLSVPIGGAGIFISKLDASGNFVWAYSIGNGSPSGNGIAIDTYYNVYTAGSFDTVLDFDTGPGTYTMVPAAGGGNDDIFVHKLNEPACPTFSLNSTTSSFTLLCSPNTLTINVVNTSLITGITYTWTNPALATSNGTNIICSTSGVYTISAKATGSLCVVTQTFNIYSYPGYTLTCLTDSANCKANGSATVTASGGTAPYTYTWSSGSNTNTAVGLLTGAYTVTTTDNNGCTAVKSCTVGYSTPPFASAPICMVTVDSLSKYNIIMWDKTAFANADSFIVYREITTNNYKRIVAQHRSVLSQFIDTVKTKYFPNTGDPNIGTYRYKLGMRDTCGNYSQFSPYHNTIWITHAAGTFSWPQLYVIEGAPNPVTGYVLWRDNLSNGNWQAVGSVAGTQQFIVDPNYNTYAATASWRIKTQWAVSCIPSKQEVSSSPSKSNVITNNQIGIKENQFDNFVSVSPNPSNGKFIVNYKSIDLNNLRVTLEIYNMTGEKVYSNKPESIDQFTVDLTNRANGIYFLVFKTDKQQYTRKLVLQQ